MVVLQNDIFSTTLFYLWVTQYKYRQPFYIMLSSCQTLISRLQALGRLIAKVKIDWRRV